MRRSEEQCVVLRCNCGLLRLFAAAQQDAGEKGDGEDADRTDLLQLIVSAYLDADGAGACGLKIAFGEECPPIVGSVPAWMRTSLSTSSRCALVYFTTPSSASAGSEGSASPMATME